MNHEAFAVSQHKRERGGDAKNFEWKPPTQTNLQEAHTNTSTCERWWKICLDITSARTYISFFEIENFEDSLAFIWFGIEFREKYEICDGVRLCHSTLDSSTPSVFVCSMRNQSKKINQWMNEWMKKSWRVLKNEFACWEILFVRFFMNEWISFPTLFFQLISHEWREMTWIVGWIESFHNGKFSPVQNCVDKVFNECEQLTSQNYDANVSIFELRHEFSGEHRDNLRAWVGRAVVIQHEKRLHVCAENSILELDAFDGRKQVDFALLQPPQHNGGNWDVRWVPNATCRIIVGTSTVQNDDFILVIATTTLAVSQLTNKGVFINQLDLRVGHLARRRRRTLLNAQFTKLKFSFTRMHYIFYSIARDSSQHIEATCTNISHPRLNFIETLSHIHSILVLWVYSSLPLRDLHDFRHFFHRNVAVISVLTLSLESFCA